MLTGFFRRPLSAALSSVTIAAALSGSLLLAPVASAELNLSYQVSVDDGVGLIVSQGVADFEGNGPVSDGLGDGIRFTLEAATCDAEAEETCAQGGSVAVLRVWETEADLVETVTGSGIMVAQSGQTRFETALSDGRVLSVVLSPDMPS